MRVPGKSSGRWLGKIFRWPAAAACAWGGWRQLQEAYRAAGIMDGLIPTLVTLSLILLIAFLLLPEALALATSPLIALVDSVFRPGGKPEPPGIDYHYRLIDSYRQQGRWEDLAATCEKLRRQHPKELRPYQELIALYSVNPEQGDHKKHLLRIRKKANKYLTEDEIEALDLLPGRE